MDDIKSITLAAVGDISLGVGVRDIAQKHGVDFIFSNVIDELNNSDLRIGNLETVFYGDETAAGKGRGDICWAPENVFASVSVAGFNILTLANNHIMDFGNEGLINTINLLDNNNILHTGAHVSSLKAREPAILDLGFMLMGVLSYADDEGQTAAPNRPGVAETIEKNVLRDIRALKTRVDTIILSLHMDLEFTHYPDPYKVSFARKAAKAGASVVLCHHPHVLQGIEVYNGSLICYSLGNCVFQVHGSDYQSGFLPHTAWSVIIKIRLSKNGYLSHTLVPIVIGTDHRPSIALGADGERIIDHIERISGPLGDDSRLERFYRAACVRYARDTYWCFRRYLSSGDLVSIARRLRFLARRPQRRWIAGYIRHLLSKLIDPLRSVRAHKCPGIIRSDSDDSTAGK